MVKGSPLVKTDVEFSQGDISAGQSLRISGEPYLVTKTGVEVQQVVVGVSSDNFDAVQGKDFYRLRLSGFNGVNNATTGPGCLPFNASAQQMQTQLEHLMNVGEGQVIVTRRGTGVFGDSFLYRIYFEGPNVHGDVPQLEVMHWDHSESSVGGGEVCGNGVAFDNGATVKSSTVIEGGHTEHQKLSLAVDSGYIKGDFFQLRFNSAGNGSEVASSTTPCIEGGISASDLESELLKLNSLTDKNLTSSWGISVNTTQLEVFGSNDLVLSGTGKTDGIIFVGDYLKIVGGISGEGTGRDVYKVTAVGGGSAGEGIALSVTPKVFVGAGQGVPKADVTKVDMNAVHVRRDGFGRGSVEVQEIHVTANATVPPTANDQAGLFRLAWRFPKWKAQGSDGHSWSDGEMDSGEYIEKVTECIPYDADAQLVQGAINRLLIDFSDDGQLNYQDLDHVNVTRSGDGSSSSGYGYTYQLKFGGRNHYRGLSTVLGDVSDVRVGGYGAAGGCADLRPTTEALVSGVTVQTQNDTSGNSAVLLNENDVDLRGILRPGDRIRVEGSEDPWRVYTVAAINGRQDLTLHETFKCGNKCGSEKAIWLVSNYGEPSLWVETVVEGSDQWSYDIYFTGQELGNVKTLQVVEEGDGACEQFEDWVALGGMVRDVSIATVQDGGSSEVIELNLKVLPTDAANNYEVIDDDMVVPELGPQDQTAGAFIMMMKSYDSDHDSADAGIKILSPDGTARSPLGSDNSVCFPWNVSSLSLKTAFGNDGSIETSRIGLGDETSNFGYKHIFKFVGDDVKGDVQLVAASHLDLGAIVFLPSSETLSSSMNGGGGSKTTQSALNDVITFGAQGSEGGDSTSHYSGTDSGLYRIEYLGPKTYLNGTREFTEEQFQWSYASDATNEASPQTLVGDSATFTIRNFTAGEAVELSNNITVTLSQTLIDDFNVGDAWVLLIAVCEPNVGTAKDLYEGAALYPVPRAAVSITTMVDIEGTADTEELTLEDAFTGDMDGEHDLWVVNPEYAVRMPGTEVQRILLGDSALIGSGGGDDQSWYNEDPTFTLTWKGVQSTCLKWNARDHEVQEALKQIGCHVSVTRGLDSADAPHGYVWSIYFDSLELDNTDVPQLIANTTGNTRVGSNGTTIQCLGLNESLGEFVTVETITQGNNQGGRFRSASHTCGPHVHNDCPEAKSVPLATPLSGAYGHQALPPAYWAGGDGTTGLDVYKVSGLRYAVKFDSNLGDLSLLDVDNQLLPGSSPNVKELVKGSLPTQAIISDLPTGLKFHTRTVVSNSLNGDIGYGNMSDSWKSAVASGVPASPGDLSVAVALHVDEVQRITLAATHISEVQRITTTSDSVPEVQLVSMIGQEGTKVKGNFGLHFPEVQKIKLMSQNEVNGTYKLMITHYETADEHSSSSGGLVKVVENTTCMSWHSTPSVMKKALEATNFIGKNGVDVKRSGDGLQYSPAGSYGYEFEVSFIGNNVAGNVEQMKASSEGCDTGRDVASSGGLASIAITTVETPQGGPVDDWKKKYYSGVGTGTEIQKLVVKAGSPLTLGTGAYHLNFSFGGGNFATRCIEWSATASQLEEALEELENIDSVLVERSSIGGDNNDQDGYGFIYSIFFDGNVFRPRDSYSDDLDYNEDGFLYAYSNDTSRPGLLTVDYGGCSKFSTTIDGVITPLSNETKKDEATGGGASSYYNVDVDRIERAGFDLSYDASSSDVRYELELLTPIVDPKMHVAVSDFDDQDGLSWTLTYASNDGNVPQVACGVDDEYPSNTAYCEVRTIVGGNTLGGSFILDGSTAFDFDVSTTEMAAELSTLDGLGAGVEVSREPLDGRGGFVWSVTFPGAEGDVALMRPSNSLTGTGASIKVEEVTKGNNLGGYFTLGLDGHLSTPLNYDATTAEVEAALEALPSVGAIAVSSNGYVDTESGRGWTVTFYDSVNPGDVSSLVATADTLTGVGAAILIEEVVKGSEATGSEAKLSFSSPHYCSYTPTKKGECGAPVTSYEVEWDTVSDFSTSGLSSHTIDSANLLYTVQRVVTQSSGGGRGVEASIGDWSHASGQSMSGTFQLSFGGHVTTDLPAYATAQQVRYALEALPSIDTVRVTRQYAQAAAPLSGLVDLAYGSHYVTCTNTTDEGDCGILTELRACDLVQLGGDWYRAKDMWSNLDGSASRLVLARADDCAVAATYQGASTTGSEVFAWGGGYEWSVTFLRLPENDQLSIYGVSSSPPLELISAPAHNLVPRSSIIHIRGADCIGCYYLPRRSANEPTNNGLALGVEYFVRISANNIRGLSTPADPKSIVPNAVPASPEAASVAVVSGHQIEIFWCPPSLSAGDVNEFVVQWDSDSKFRNASHDGEYAPCNGGRGEFGSCSVTGAAITGPCPYSFLVRGLKTGVEYYSRVSGKNYIPVQEVLPEELVQPGDQVDNTHWSGVLRATPEFVPPQAPREVVLSVLDGHRMQAQVMQPLRDGGRNITKYELDIDTELSFQTVRSRTISYMVDNLPFLYDGEDPPYVLEVDGLTPGTFYFVRVRAVSSVGDSLSTPALNHPLAPTQLALPPSYAAASTVDPTELAPSTEIEVSWLEPPYTASGDGGTALTGYLVEWWEASSITEEVQAVRLSWNPGDIPEETWSLRWNGEQTNGLKADASAANVRDALMNLHSSGSQNDTFLLGPLDVTRTTVNGDEGYVYSITFKDDSGGVGYGGLNNGDVPILVVEDVFGGSATSTSYEVDSGVRASGTNEVQVISSYGTGEGTRGAGEDGNPDDAVIRGYWRIAFGGSVFSSYISAEANASDVEAALESLNTVGDVNVTREFYNDSYTEGGDNGYRWLVTFITPVGDRQPVVLDTQYIWSTNGDATFEVQDGNNEVTHLGVLTCDGCFPGEKPVGYGSARLDPDTRGYLIEELTPGTKYYATVSALNKHGQGERKFVNGGEMITSPVVVPGVPTDVSIAVNTGSADSLLVSYNPPVTDGGALVTHYRVELDPATTTDYRDPTTTFQSPISEIFSCPTQPTYEVWTVSTAASNATYTGGHFALQLTRGGSDLLTDAIPYNAPALASEESPSTIRSKSNVYCENDDDNNLAYCPSSRLTSSGSMQSKMQALESLGSDGVSVSRRNLGNGNYVWSITFLDTGGDFELAPVSVGKDGTTTALTGHYTGSNKALSLGYTSVETAKVQAGVVHGACSGSLVVPSVGGLVTGQYYYARVFAYNQKGYGAAATALTPEKPMVTPGRPTGVALEVYSATALKVVFHPPTDDGGDAVDSYLIEYSTSPVFETGTVGNASVVMLSAGAPYYRVIPNLVTGTDYWVRVLAHNSQGYGAPQASSPAYDHPMTEPSPPMDVTLGSTSDTMLTVGFSYPLSDGGDNVTHFKIEWDTAPSFQSLSSHPDRGSAVVSADTERSYTIEYLTTYKLYYVRVSGRNGAGWGQPRVASPVSAKPQLQVPGHPVSVRASPGTHDGYLNVRFDSPRVPKHGIPCGGLSTSLAAKCPTPVGGNEDAANGGSEIVAYKVEWSIDPDFASSEYDAGSTEVDGFTAYTVRNLTIGNRYYVRVAARNIMGYSSFCGQEGGACDGDQASALSTNSTSV
jgi:hypothetical protein